MNEMLMFSLRSIELLDSCKLLKDIWKFEAINSVLLLEQLVEEPESKLSDYLKSECEDPEADPNDVMLDALTDLGVEIKDIPSSDHEANVILKDEGGDEHKYPVSEEVTALFETLGKICNKRNTKKVEPIHFTLAMFEAKCPALKRLFSDMNISYSRGREYFNKEFGQEDETESKEKKLKIPNSLSGFLTCLNNKVDTQKPCDVLMRDKEIEQIWNISLKMNKRNSVIVGEAGVGKSALVEKITYDICKGTCPEKFKGFYVVSLDVNSLIAGTEYRGQAEQRIKALIEFLKEHHNVILFIDEVHTILGAGSCRDGEMDLSNALKPILARGDTIVIGATTDNEYENYFASDAALSRRFEKVIVEEPKSEEVYPMIKNKIKRLSENHGVKISKDMVEYAILISHCFAFEKKNPDKTLDLIDRSMVVAYRKGKPHVEKDDILANFAIFFDLFEGMGDDARKETAYHEAGHYIVGKISDKLVAHRWLAVSIMPAEDYLGVTCYEFKKDRVPFRNRDYYLDEIAFCLAGRVAEKLFRGEYTSGAGEDLNSATRTAFNVITKYGMTAGDGERNNIFLNTKEYPMFSEKSTNLINDEVQKLVDAGIKRAEEIIYSHQNLLQALVKALLQKRIMGEPELDRIWKKYVS